MSADRRDQGPAQDSASGPETWATVAGVKWCWWDLWFCVLVVADFGGDLDRLEADLVGRLRSPGWTGVSGSDVESKLSHLADLRARLAGAGIGAGALDVAGRRPGVLPRARSRILKKPAQRSSMTAAMAEPPRVRLERRARRGHWDSFPVDPADFYERFRRSVEVRDFIHEGRTFALTRQLWDRLCHLDDTCLGVADRLALFRAFHTAGLELADNADDSYGVVGELRVDAFEIYVGIDWAAAEMADEAYWQDLCELMVWEPYSLTWQHEALPFKRAKAAHAEMIEGILFALADEHRSAHLDRHADEALALAARLHIAGRRYRRYAATAGRLNRDQIGPVIELAESALRGHRLDVAIDVFRAAGADGRGGPRLRERCLELTGVSLGDEPG